MRCVYLIRNLINGKVYVGQTKDFDRRKADHLYNSNRGSEKPLYYSMRKHGTDNFTFEVLEECADDLINEREQYWVAHFDSFNPERGYNLTCGGNQNFERSEETRRKIGDFWRGRKQSPEHVERRVAKLRGQKRTVEQRKRISESQRGITIGRRLGPISEGRRQRLRQIWEQKRLERSDNQRDCAVCGSKFEVRRRNRTHQTCGPDCRRRLIGQKLMGNQNHRGND